VRANVVARCRISFQERGTLRAVYQTYVNGIELFVDGGTVAYSNALER
jgi:hypothetical protein